MLIRPGRKRRLISGDLILTALIGLWTAFAGIAGVRGMAGQAIFTTLGILVLPGYALVAFLFPGRRLSAGTAWTASLARLTRGETDGVELGVIERLLLGVGLSVSVVPLLGVGLAFTPWGVRPSSFLGVVGVTTALLAVTATVRRWRLAPRDRFEPRMTTAVAAALRRLRAPGTTLST